MHAFFIELIDYKRVRTRKRVKDEIRKSESVLTISSGLNTPNWTILTSRKGAGEPDTKAITLLQQDGRFDEVILSKPFRFCTWSFVSLDASNSINYFKVCPVDYLCLFSFDYGQTSLPFRRKSAKELSFFVPAEWSAPKALLSSRSLSPHIYSKTLMCGVHQNSSGEEVALWDSPSDVVTSNLFRG